MNFRNIPLIDYEYRNQLINVVNEFYIPVLSQAKIYRRAVGYFSSDILVRISKGIGRLIKNGGSIQLLISPKLSVEDFEVFKKSQAQGVSNFFLEHLNELIDNESKDRLGLLYYLLVTKKLIVKFAVLEKSGFGIYHEKLGILKDEEGNSVVFTGSANETIGGIENNYEAIDVFTSWKSEEGYKRCALKEHAFDKLWNNEDKAVKTLDVSIVLQEKLFKYKKEENDNEIVSIDEDYLRKENLKIKTFPKNPNKKFHDYQIKAILNWEENNYIGIYDMATGTGKTFAALGSIVHLFGKIKPLFVVIIVPYIHLVDQWGDEAEDFNIYPLLISSANKKWKDELSRKVSWFKLNKSPFECIITTNASFKNENLQNELKSISTQTLIIVDEAHNFGSYQLSTYFEVNYKYRLALSATVDRYRDELGTKKIYDFFDKKVITVNLGDAIQNDFLTPYEYFPILVSLSEKEKEKYYDYSEKISRILARGKFEDLSFDERERIKRYALSRSRVIAGAENKVKRLFEIIKEKYLSEYNLLIYCGAVDYTDTNSESENTEDLRQIDYVIKELAIKYGMLVSRFTSMESKTDRMKIKKSFIENDIQALVAIKCLDEGVNIPSIKTAFILASSTNPREYVQRRGRVLRKFDGKKISTIYDFITLVSPLEEIDLLNENSLKFEANHMMKELKRLRDFALLSNNPAMSNDIIFKLEDVFDLNTIKIYDEGDLYE
jgi:superfamily II DNA or RNA helicase